jgi:hypothetical protein
MMQPWVIYGLSMLSATLVAVGVFVQVAAIIRQRKTFLGFFAKILGLVPLFFAVRDGRTEVVSISLIFFSTAVITLAFLTLARHKLLR